MKDALGLTEISSCLKFDFLMPFLVLYSIITSTSFSILFNSFHHLMVSHFFSSFQKKNSHKGNKQLTKLEDDQHYLNKETPHTNMFQNIPSASVKILQSEYTK
ncbi:CLUMA_CG005261, isoform A [Clunio marinus]|uniref:CLUMA_CG005261, isoform A n=1 Tax=Clunio marinus TaxID=568069 RepID=A0A1J1HU58_9DIPT|nr:CLUMA_CG005261, isoform A [Clunio marinus]